MLILTINLLKQESQSLALTKETKVISLLQKQKLRREVQEKNLTIIQVVIIILHILACAEH